jgi:hypothetical protein
MWGKYAYVVAIHNPGGSWVFRDQMDYRVGRMSKKSLDALMAACPDTEERFKLTKGRRSSWKFYFAEKTDFDHFCKVAEITCRYHISEIMQPSVEDQIDVLRSNGFVVYRSHWFHNEYEWKVTFQTNLGKQTTAEVIQWCVATLADENDASRVKLRSSSASLICYLKHEDDVLMTKLTYSGIIKNVARAIIVEPVVHTKNNNNNKGTIHAPSTLSPPSRTETDHSGNDR